MMVGLIHCKGVELFVLGLGLERNHLIRVEYDSKANLANIYWRASFERFTKLEAILGLMKLYAYII